MERKIGETFEFEGKKLKVVENNDNSGCEKCFFCNRECSSIRDVRGFCSEELRTDKKHVIFVKAKDEQPQEQAEQPKDEQPQHLNLCEILKYCPQGEQFWSPMLGDVVFYDINQNEGIVRVKMENGKILAIKTDGTITICGITSPEVMIYPSREQRDWSKVKYEPKNVLPRAWEELCQQNPITKLEYFIGESSEVRKATIDGAKREVEFDRNVLPSKQAAEAHLALMQLHQLRDAWREGWLPDWTEDNQRKYVICSLDGEFLIRIRYTNRYFLAFQDEKRAYEFKDCFIDLIRKAGDLI